MSKLNKKSINLSFEFLTILAFSVLFIPAVVSASYGTNFVYSTGNDYNEMEINNPKPSVNSINPKFSNVGVGTKTVTITGNGFVPSSVARINGSNRPTTFIDNSHLLVQINGNDTYAYRTNGGFFITVFNGAPGGGYSNAAFFTINTTTALATTNTNNNSSTTNFSDTNYPNTTTQPNNFTDENFSDLTSNVIYGSNSFLPSGAVQWILFAIVILLLVILARKFFGGEEQYLATPLKHD
jgi:hypothetical protein